jgi:hypothetical protein
LENYTFQKTQQLYKTFIDSQGPWLGLHSVTHENEVNDEHLHVPYRKDALPKTKEKGTSKTIDRKYSTRWYSGFKNMELHCPFDNYLFYFTKDLEPEYWHGEGHAPARMKGCENSERILFTRGFTGPRNRLYFLIKESKTPLANPKHKQCKSYYLSPSSK